eukprot:645498-Prymnesium_polylepis.1
MRHGSRLPHGDTSPHRFAAQEREPLWVAAPPQGHEHRHGDKAARHCRNHEQRRAVANMIHDMAVGWHPLSLGVNVELHEGHKAAGQQRGASGGLGVEVRAGGRAVGASGAIVP